MAVELGGKRVRVNAISAGPVATRSASGVSHFDELLNGAARRSPEHRLITPDDVGALAAFLVSDAASAIMGNISYVDAGYHWVEFSSSHAIAARGVRPSSNRYIRHSEHGCFAADHSRKGIQPR
jgi:enoyl-[acyl-carrier-protein] reductase (NADH)